MGSHFIAASMWAVVWGAGLLLPFLATVQAECPKFSGDYPNIYINEDGTFILEQTPVGATDTSAITIEDTAFCKYFQANKNEAGDTWVLEIQPGLTDWYDGLVSPDDPDQGSKPQVPLTITYTCNGTVEDYNHIISIAGENNRKPEFDKATYEATITKLMPPDVPLHFVDTTLDILAVDHDYVNVNAEPDDTSNNTVATCIVGGDSESVIKCEAQKEGDSEMYRMFVSLKKKIDTLPGSSYAFTLEAQDGGDPALKSDPVTVTLKFPDEDLLPPKFTETFYTADMITETPSLPFTIHTTQPVIATDGDTAINAGITYSVVSPQNYFKFEGEALQLTEALTQEMILARLVTVVVKATENTDTGRSSVVVVNIPIAGDDNSPQLEPSFYTTKLSSEDDGSTWTMDPVAPFKPTDKDSMLENNGFTFKLDGGTFDVNNFFVLSTMKGTESTLQLKAGLDIKKLPNDGEVSFFIKVSEILDPTKSIRSLITVNYPFPLDLTTTPAPTITPTINPTNSPTTDCPVCSTTSAPTECPTVPSTTTTKATPTGDEYVSFISGDNNGTTQYVGYPGFIPLQNSAPMPIAKVKANCSLPWCDGQITYSMQSQPNFFIDQQSGDIFLVDNAGFGSIQTTCEEPCTLTVFADLSNTDVVQAILTVKVSTLSESQILVLDSNSSYTAAEEVLSDINKGANVSGKYWFRLINIQPKEEASNWYRSGVSPEKSVLFVTANNNEDHLFVDKEVASGIINGATNSDVAVDSTIQVNNQPEEGSGGGSKTAVIVLAVILALVILAVLIAIFVINRKFFLSMLTRKKKENEILQSSTENSSITAYKVEEQKPRKNSKGLFNLQSVTIQTSQPSNNPRGRPAVGGSAQPGLMREMSTGLEKRLESKAKPSSSKPQQASSYKSSYTNNTQVPAKKKAAPNVPPPSSIKFNERAEVMEVEKTKRLSISSGTSDSSADSSSSGSSSSSGDSALDDNEKVTRI